MGQWYENLSSSHERKYLRKKDESCEEVKVISRVPVVFLLGPWEGFGKNWYSHVSKALGIELSIANRAVICQNKR